MAERYIFRRASRQEVPAVFALIMRRVAGMDRVGIRQWNTTKYGVCYPLDYYEQRRKGIAIGLGIWYNPSILCKGRKKMKKIALLMVLALLACCCIGCGSDKSDENTNAATESIPLPGELDHCMEFGHEYMTEVLSDPSCTDNGQILYMCLYCGEGYTETVQAYGHTTSPASCTEDAVCIECGAVAAPATGHSGSDICDTCGQPVN